MEHIDWQVVVDRSPKGYVELNNGKHIYYGPVDRVEVIDDNVEIFVQWAAKKQLDRHGIPVGKWEVTSREPSRLIKIPNNTAPFVIESTPEKGDRVRFGMVNILYFDQVGKLTLEQVQADQASA